MPQPLSIVQLGRGQVGSRLVAQVAAARAAVIEEWGVDLRHAMVAGRDDGPDPGAILERAARTTRPPRLFVDATAAEGMAPVHRQALEAGFHVVTCNKKPLAGPLAEYEAIRRAARSAGRYYLFEVTVGAGLPVIATLRDLRDTGDRVETIEGCFSGTLNFLCASLDAGQSFSEALRLARDRGFTEPDPRDDLDGQDVARKAIILARAAGIPVEADEMRREPFVAVDRGEDRERFLQRAGDHDDPLRERVRAAASRGQRLRYVARVSPGEGCRAGLAEVPADSPLGRLNGPENVFVFTTGRYHHHPLVVSGPGAGPDVTAAGAFADLMTVVRAVARGGNGSARSGSARNDA